MTEDEEVGFHKHSEDGVLLTLTGDIARRWKDYFEDVLNPAFTCSVVEAESWESGLDSPITQAEVVGKLLVALGVIHPEFFNSLDVVGLSWLTLLFNIRWRSGTAPSDWQTGWWFPF